MLSLILVNEQVRLNCPAFEILLIRFGPSVSALRCSVMPQLQILLMFILESCLTPMTACCLNDGLAVLLTVSCRCADTRRLHVFVALRS